MWKKIAALWLVLGLNYSVAQEFEAVQLYTQDELVDLINQNKHLERVKKDECQLVQDIEARAAIIKEPSYQFLWGDMLAWGVCVDKNAELGMYYMWQAADQGLAAALEQLGRYYHKGILVQKDMNKAIPLLRESASLGFLRAQIQLVEIFVQGYGSPRDFEDAYRWLHHAIIPSKVTHKKVAGLLAKLAQRMPENIVARAKRIPAG